MHKNYNCVSRGFTLLDLLIVVMILGVLGMIAIPQFHAMVAEAKLNEAAGELVSALEYSGYLAVQYQRTIGVEADVTGNWFRVLLYGSAPPSGSDLHANADGVVLNPFDKKWYEKDFDIMSAYEGVSITSVPGGGSRGDIRFYPVGHMPDPLGSDKSIVVSYAGNQKTITVDVITASIRVE